jgi:dephospho-CoA kinase
VTGGIGSGKSTVIGVLATLGATVIDTDAIAHALTAAGGGAIADIGVAFGAPFIGPDGALDRQRMRALVFADPHARRRLEALLHPRILARCLQMARAADAHAPLVVFDVPLLVEATAVRKGLQLDRTLVVDCPPDRQLAHALARGGMSARDIESVISAQAPRAARLALADDVIVNAATRADLERHVRQLWSHYCPEAAAGSGTVARAV